jgi:hypothetical protein
MTTTTVTPSRRAALGALASIPALAIPAAALPAAAMAASTPAITGAATALDAELFALIAAAREARHGSKRPPWPWKRQSIEPRKCRRRRR